jgi:nitrate reductase delta subunit
MKILTVISRLLEYPDPLLWDNRDLLLEAIRQQQDLVPRNMEALLRFVRDLTSRDVMDAQDDYGALFDRGRSLSLLLFEHVHGDSRDRGQAMVDLMGLYEKSGFAINVRELPDHIPLFLEFLATRTISEVLEWMGDAGHILVLLSVRLKQRESPYAVLFDALLEVGQIQQDTQALQETVKAEPRDDTQEAIDKVWEEEATLFGGSDVSGGCPSNRPSGPSATQPVASDTLVAVKWVEGQQAAEQRISTRQV